MGEDSDLLTGWAELRSQLTHVVQQGDTTVRRDDEIKKDDAALGECARRRQSLFDAEDKPGEEQFCDARELRAAACGRCARRPKPAGTWALMKAVGESSGANLHEAIRDATGTKPKIKPSSPCLQGEVDNPPLHENDGRRQPCPRPSATPTTCWPAASRQVRQHHR